MSEIDFLDAAVQVVQPVEKVIPTADKSRSVEPYGEIKADDLKIFLTERIFAEMMAHSNSTTAHEVGGVFPGTLYCYRGVPYITIEGYIPAAGDGRAASFRFTPEAWTKINRENMARHGDRILVGWHHTHPGYGVFLSSYDQFICRHFFNEPWMVAMVVDPKAQTLGFFQWKQGRIEPCGFFFVR